MSSPIPQIPSDTAQVQQSTITQNAAKTAAVQEGMANSLTTFIEDNAVNTMQIIRRNSEPLEEKVKKRVRTESSDKQEPEDENFIEIEATAEISGYYENKNPELKGKSLQSLKDQISEFDTAEDVLQKVLESFPDPVMADAAFDYLLEVLPSALTEKVQTARVSFEKRFGRSLRAGQNIFEESLKFSKDGLAAPSELRQVYVELTGDPKNPLDLFQDLLNKFTFEKMKPAIAFWLSALGSDLRSKGSSIEPGDLSKLIGEVKTLQAILSVYKFFASKQRELILNLARKNTEATPEMNYQNLAKLFVKLLQDKYPSPDKILFIKHDLQIDAHLLAQEAVLNIMCSAIKGVAPSLYRNQKHQDEVLNCFLIALEAIDNVLGDQ